MKLFDDSAHTHMPFVFEGKLLHCKGTGRVTLNDMGPGRDEIYLAYDIYCADLNGQNAFYIGANLGERVIACSPNAYRDFDGSVVLNYVAVQMTPDTVGYLHYQRRGKDLTHLGEHQVIPEPQRLSAKCQSENRWFSYTVYPEKNKSALVQYDKDRGWRRNWTFKNMSVLQRAVCVDDTSLVLTYTDSSDVTKSAILETDDHTVADIKVGGKDVYKCHLHNGTLYHAVRAPADKYGMGIHTDSYTLEASCLVPSATSWY